jgi:hypothetical protein
MSDQCSTCRWFVSTSGDVSAGECHGAPPSPAMGVFFENAQVIAGRTDAPYQRRAAIWPVVRSDDFCGRHAASAPPRKR